MKRKRQNERINEEKVTLNLTPIKVIKNFVLNFKNLDDWPTSEELLVEDIYNGLLDIVHVK